MNPCKACHNTKGNINHVAREMMLGRRSQFIYQECSNCGSLQILDIPPDLADYYPSAYYSFQKPGTLKTFLKSEWASYTYRHSGLVGRLLSLVLGENPSVAALRNLSLNLDAAILDIGCGSGDLLRDLAALGFKSLRGVDPFNSQEIRFDDVIIWKSELSEIDGKFDLIMFHHSLEHMADPRQVFAQLPHILKPGGTVLIRVPVAACWAWQEYKTNWVQLDAPRHLFIPSSKGMQLLAADTGFHVTQVIYDSTDFQFWGSEQYQGDIALSDKRSHHRNPLNLVFPSKKIRQYRRRAQELNHQAAGDQACFFLRKH